MNLHDNLDITWEEISQMVRDMFLAGVSTRRVGKVLTKIKCENGDRGGNHKRRSYPS